MLNELQAYLDSMTDHNEILHNHADVLEEHEVRLSQLEQVINTPAPEPGAVEAAEEKVKDGEEPEFKDSEPSETPAPSEPEED